jgi:predicted nucleotidyltransferase
MLDVLRPLLEHDGRFSYALIFGSTTQGSAHARSDLDIAVGLSRGSHLSALDLGELVSLLEAAAKRPVDLVLMDEAAPGLAYRVFRDGEVLFVRDRGAFVERKARAILEYLDFQPIEEQLARGALAASVRGR